MGTIKRNPEIFLKKRIPDFKYLLKTQKNLLEKAKQTLNINGTIIYMVCSFLKIETVDIISTFLKENKNFSYSSFNIKNEIASKLNINDKYFNIMPTSILTNIEIDGFFAVKLLKND